MSFGSALSANPRGYFGYYETPYQTPRPFDEYKLVCETAFQQKANGIVSGHIRRLYQHFILGTRRWLRRLALGIGFANRG